MKQSVFLLAFLLVFAVFNAVAADSGADLLAIKDLGAVNGQALACAAMPSAQHAKSMMLAHAPKTQVYGDAFQASTNEAFLAQTKDGGSCATAEAFEARLNDLEKRLNELLPVPAAPSAQH
ncbi:MAG: hypothetical protein PHU46_11270 [Rhodocyclaceae bacterium]|nr:hypothetical protein [Rhodocyclaceae bacterium]